MSATLALTAMAIILLVELVRRWHIHPEERGPWFEGGRLEKAGQGEFYFHACHSWAMKQSPELIDVGVDDFAARFIGRIESVEIRKPGSLVRQGEPLVTMRHGRRSLTLAAPLTGILRDVNTRLLSDPGLINESPYEKGWIARLSPTRLRIDLRNLVSPSLAQRWRESAREKLMLRFPHRLGKVLQDGGQLSDSIGDLLGDEDWELLVKILFPLHTATIDNNSTMVTE